MPVTIKSNLVKIRDNPNAAYTSMDVISDSTTAERIQQITSAANTAQTQIENKKNVALSQITSVSNLQNMISQAYSDTKTYAVGDYVVYNDRLYRCATAITSAETWTASHWTQVIFSNEVKYLKDYSYTTSGSYLTLIAANSDLNNYTIPGNYRIANYATATQINNIPVYLGGRLTVIGLTDNNGLFQHYVATNGTIYIRVNQNNTWGTWVKIVTEDKIIKVQEDITEINNRALAAFSIETTNGEIAFAPDGADDLPIKDIKIGINSVQDLHGYKYPWPAGGGKNLCNITLTSYSRDGITATVNNNGSITLNGTTTANNVFFNINYVNKTQLTIPVNTPIKFGAMVDKSSAVRVQLITDGASAALATQPLTNAGFNISSDYTFSNDVTNNWLRIQVESINTQIDNVTIYPFWCLSSNPLTEWEPYSNICPISGWNSASITVTGKNYQPTLPAANVKGVLIQPNNNGSYNISGMFMFNADYAQQNAPHFHLEPGQYIITCKGATENYTYNFGKFTNGTWSQIANISNVNTGSATSVIFDVESADVEYMGRLRVHYTSNISKVNITNFCPMIQRIDKYKKYDISFPTTAGTVYGGTLNINENGSGELIVDKKQITISSASRIGDDPRFLGKYAYVAMLSDCKEQGSGVFAQNILCDTYRPVTVSSDRGPFDIYVVDKACVIINPEFTTLDKTNEILAAQRPVLIYNLMDPIIYSLTAEQITTFIGENNISTNTGNIINLNYRTNTDNIINKALSSFPSDTVNGPIAHYIDGIDVPVKSLIVTINPIQLGTGDPSVDNIRPINGWDKIVIAQTGANILTHSRFDLPITLNGITWSRSESGRIIANGTATAESTIGFNFVPNTEIIPQGTYIYGGCPNGGSGTTYNVYAFDYTDNKRPQREETDTRVSLNVTNSTETASFYVPRGHAVRINLRVKPGVTVNNLIFAPFVVSNNQNPTWSNPVNNIVPIVFPTEIGTTYGGKIDVLSGTLTVTHKIYTFNGSEYWGSPQTGVRFEVSLAIPDVISSWFSGGRGLSNIGVYINNDKDVDVPYITSRTNINTNGNVHTLVFPLNIASSIDEVKAFLAAHNEQWYAPLAYPIIYQLPPIAVKSYLGENNIFSDAGEVSVVYRADPSMYIDRKISEAIAALNIP